MRTDTTRAIRARNELALPTDFTDAEWAVLEPLLAPALPVGRPRKWPMRRIVEAILYLLRGVLGPVYSIQSMARTCGTETHTIAKLRGSTNTEYLAD